MVHLYQERYILCTTCLNFAINVLIKILVTDWVCWEFFLTFINECTPRPFPRGVDWRAWTASSSASGPLRWMKVGWATPYWKYASWTGRTTNDYLLLDLFVRIDFFKVFCAHMTKFRKVFFIVFFFVYRRISTIKRHWKRPRAKKNTDGDTKKYILSVMQNLHTVNIAVNLSGRQNTTNFRPEKHSRTLLPIFRRTVCFWPVFLTGFLLGVRGP